jgi:polysaccharide transporter, PST family
MSKESSGRGRLHANALRLGIATFVGLVAGILVSKLVASTGGTSGVARYGLIVAVVTLVAILADGNIGPGLVVKLSHASKENNLAEFEHYVRAARVITFAGGSTVVTLLTLFSVVFGFSTMDALTGVDVVLAGLAGAFTMAANQELNVLTGAQAFRERTRLAMVLPLLGVAGTGLFLWVFGLSGLAGGVLFGSVVSWGVGRHVNANRGGGPIRRETVRELLRFGLPMSANVVVGFGMVTAQPILVTVLVGSHTTGLWKAALGLSAPCIAWVTLQLNSDYFPKISRDSVNAANEAMATQLRMVLLVVTPILALLVLVSRVLFRYLYSPEFVTASSAAPILFLGDLLRVSAWCGAYAILSKFSPKMLFLSEFGAGAVLVVATVVLTPRFGIRGVAVASLLSALCYLLTVGGLCRSSFPGFCAKNYVRMISFPVAALIAVSVLEPFSKPAAWALLFLLVIRAINGLGLGRNRSANSGTARSISPLSETMLRPAFQNEKSNV